MYHLFKRNQFFKMLVSITLISGILYSMPAMAAQHLISIASCPPWKAIPGKPKISKKMSDACLKDVTLIEEGFQYAMQIPSQNIVRLVNENASYQKVIANLEKYADTLTKDDRLVIYVNAHGGFIEALYEGYTVKDETLALYTKDKPTDFSQAVADKQWMQIRTFRDAIDKIKAGQIVVIFDICHAGEGIHDFKYDNQRYENWEGKEAIIFSSHADQIANFTQDGKLALFTNELSKALKNAELGKDSLSNVFEKARLSTHRKARANCLAGHTLKELTKEMSDYLTFCTQMPEAFDPFGLLDEIQL